MNFKNSKPEYIYRINRVLDHIDQNLHKQLNLEELADVANFSKFHFSRIFSAIVGQAPVQFILHRRLEKAAALIFANQQQSISEIAYKCGFSDISVFSRYFKKHFNVPPSLFREEHLQNSKIGQQVSKSVQSNEAAEIYFCSESQTIKWKTKMEICKGVEVQTLPKTTVAYVRNIGPFNGDQQMFQNLRNKLFTWAGARDLLYTKDFKFLVMYHDDPNIATGNNLRMNICISVPPETEVSGEIGKMEVGDGKYAIAHFEMTGHDFQKAWNWVYGEWLPNSGYQPDDKPCFESYVKAPSDGQYAIDICVPIKPI